MYATVKLNGIWKDASKVPRETPPFLKKSIEQVSELGHYLSDTHFDLVLSSDLPRAKKTTELIMESQKTKAKITYTKDLREWQLGKLEGQKLSIIQAIYPKEMDAFRHNLANFRANNFQAESVHHTTKRVADLVRTLKDSSMKNVLLVGHGANLTASIVVYLALNLVFFVKPVVLTMHLFTILETDDCGALHSQILE